MLVPMPDGESEQQSSKSSSRSSTGNHTRRRREEEEKKAERNRATLRSKHALAVCGQQGSSEPAPPGATPESRQTTATAEGGHTREHLHQRQTVGGPRGQKPVHASQPQGPREKEKRRREGRGKAAKQQHHSTENRASGGRQRLASTEEKAAVPNRGTTHASRGVRYSPDREENSEPARKATTRRPQERRKPTVGVAARGRRPHGQKPPPRGAPGALGALTSPPSLKWVPQRSHDQPGPLPGAAERDKDRKDKARSAENLDRQVFKQQTASAVSPQRIREGRKGNRRTIPA